MKASIRSVVAAVIVMVSAGLSACATTSGFNAKLETWKGESADKLVQAWGQPDAIEALHTGDKMYVYARLKHAPIAFAEFQKKTASNSAQTASSRKPTSVETGIYIHCSTYFEVNHQNTVESVMFRGDDCK
jgi:hypothetical protein